MLGMQIILCMQNMLYTENIYARKAYYVLKAYYISLVIINSNKNLLVVKNFDFSQP